MSDQILEILKGTIGTAATSWSETSLTTAELYAAIERVRNETSYEHTCGSTNRPHVFHPAELARLLPVEQFPTHYFEATAWAFCANCGLPWPMSPWNPQETGDGEWPFQ